MTGIHNPDDWPEPGMADKNPVHPGMASFPAAVQPVHAGYWRPIETAPKDGTEFLAWWKHPTADSPGVILTHWLDNSKTRTPWAGWRWPSMTAVVPGMYPSHWMPLPTAPVEVGAMRAAHLATGETHHDPRATQGAP